MRSVAMSKPFNKVSLRMATIEIDLFTAAAESDPDVLPLTDEKGLPFGCYSVLQS